MSENTTAKKTGVDKLIDGIEKVCNKLPPPAILFCWLFLITAIIGCIFSVMGVALTNPASGEVVTSANLFSKELYRFRSVRSGYHNDTRYRSL